MRSGFLSCLTEHAKCFQMWQKGTLWRRRPKGGWRWAFAGWSKPSSSFHRVAEVLQVEQQSPKTLCWNSAWFRDFGFLRAIMASRRIVLLTSYCPECTGEGPGHEKAWAKAQMEKWAKGEIQLIWNHLSLQGFSPKQVCPVPFRSDKYFDNIDAKDQKELLLVCRRRNHDLHMEGDVAQLAANGTEKDHEG